MELPGTVKCVRCGRTAVILTRYGGGNLPRVLLAAEPIQLRIECPKCGMLQQAQVPLPAG